MQYLSLYVHIWSITGVYVFMKAAASSYAWFALIPHPLSVLGPHTQTPERAHALSITHLRGETSGHEPATRVCIWWVGSPREGLTRLKATNQPSFASWRCKFHMHKWLSDGEDEFGTLVDARREKTKTLD